MGNDSMSRALHQISRSPFTYCIDRIKLLHHFAQLTIAIYNRRTDLVDHVRHFNHRMIIHSRNEVLKCKVFISSLGPIAIR